MAMAPSSARMDKAEGHIQLRAGGSNLNTAESKSAHTALAVKACLLGCNSATLNAQVTFVYIAVAISALAGGGPLKEFRTEPLYRWYFRVFSTIFWGWRSRRY